MRVLMLNYEYPPVGGGGGQQCQLLSKKLAQKHDVLVITSGYKKYMENTKGKNYEVRRIFNNRKEKMRATNIEMLSYVLSLYLKIGRIIKEFKPDFVHIWFGIPTGLIVFHPALNNKKIILSVRGSDVPGHSPDKSQMLYKLLAPVVKKIWPRCVVVANSNGLKEEVRQISPRQRIEVIVNAIDTDLFTPTHSNNENERLRLLYVGRLIPLKNIDKVIEVIGENSLDVEFTIVGSGDEEKKLKNLIKKYNLSDKVKLLGYIPHENLVRIYRDHDIYIQLSACEGMSNTILEAMASGLAIITTDTGGTKELIDGNGIIIPGKDSDAISKAVLNLINDHKLRENMSRKSREIAESMSWKQVAQDYFKVYKEIINKGDPCENK